jgi:hypothetical protein
MAEKALDRFFKSLFKLFNQLEYYYSRLQKFTRSKEIENIIQAHLLGAPL